MTAAMKTALQQAVVRGGIQLIEMKFDSGDVCVWSGIGDFVWDSKTFSGVGRFGGVSVIEETTENKSQSIQLSLSGVDAASISEAMTEDYLGRRLNGWIGLFDSDWQLIADPIQNIFHRMDGVEIVDGEDSATVRVTAYPRLNDLFRPRVRRHTDADQQSRFPGDRFFDQKQDLTNKPVTWGS